MNNFQRKRKDKQRNYFKRKKDEKINKGIILNGNKNVKINKGIIFNGKEMKRSTK